MRKTCSLFLVFAMLISLCAVASAEAEAPVLTVESVIYGEAFTNGYTTQKAEDQIGVVYDDTVAVITLQYPDGTPVDDHLIDASEAVVTLEDGDGYYKEMLVLNATSLSTSFVDGQATYRLASEDLVWTNMGYEADNGGLEWSGIGGDGSGHYTFNLRISGIKYNGEAVNDANFRVYIYAYGREFSGGQRAGAGGYDDMVLPKAGKVALEEKPAVTEPTILYAGEADLPILCDYATDNFYVVWPEGVDASKVNGYDTTLTMISDYGDELTLEAGRDYKVYAGEDTTQISVNFVYWPFAPVYTRLAIAVDASKAEGIQLDSVDQVFDIASVYVHSVQTGGGMAREGTVECYTVYGVDDIKSWETIFSHPYYFWACSDPESDAENARVSVLGMGAQMNTFLKENDDGTVEIVHSVDEATLHDGVGEDGYQVGLRSHTVFLTRKEATKTVEVDGKTYTFSMAFSGGSDQTPAKDEVTVAPGYVLGEKLDTHQRWAWLYINGTGWMDPNGTGK